MRLVLRTTNKNVIPERVFIGKNKDFRREIFKIVNYYTHNYFNIEWIDDCIIFKKDSDVICLYIFEYKGDAPSSLNKECFLIAE